MQQDADFITAGFLYMFRASSAHHQEYKILTRQLPVQVVMVAGRSSLCHIRNETVISGIEPATFRFVAQHLNHCATAVCLQYCHKYTGNKVK